MSIHENLNWFNRVAEELSEGGLEELLPDNMDLLDDVYIEKNLMTKHPSLMIKDYDQDEI